MFIKHLIGLGCLSALAAPLAAQQTSTLLLSTVTKVDKQISRDGVTRHELREEHHIAIGEHLVVSTNYNYNGKQPATNVVVVIPVDKSQLFTDATPTGYQVSVDGGHSWGDLEKLNFNDGNVRRPAEAGDVTHVRWTIPVLAPGTSGSVEFHAVLR